MHWMEFRDLLACPDCGGALEAGPGDRLACLACAREFPFERGVPLLYPSGGRADAALAPLASEEGRAMADEYARATDVPPARPRGWRAAIRGWLGRLREPVHHFPGAEIHRMYHPEGAQAARILSIGGGPTRNHPAEINFNLAPFANVDAVGDAHHLPFRAGTVDGIWCNAVLEHVEDAARVAAEMARVVRPGGHVCVIVPFVFPYHAYPSDYRRLTLAGLEKLFPDFERVAAGTNVGPTYAALKTVETWLDNYLPVLLPGPLRRLARPLVNLYVALFYWMKRFDRRLNVHPEGHRGAATVFYLGRRRSA